MTDLELLEFAAKAAGYQPVDMHDGLMYLYGIQAGWNPLTDDEDALRLAVKLMRFPQPLQDKSGVFCGYETATSGYRIFHSPIVEKFADDPASATRRAIVRAAAEMGKAMPKE